MTRRTHRLSFQQARALKRTGAATLTEDEVRVIKQKLAEGATPRLLASVYMVGIETIRRIRRGESWAWIEERSGEEDLPLPPAQSGEAERIAASQAELMRRLGMPLLEQTAESPDGIERLAREVQRAQEPDRLLDQLGKQESGGSNAQDNGTTGSGH